MLQKRPKPSPDRKHASAKKMLFEQLRTLLIFTLFFLAGAYFSFLSGGQPEHCFYSSVAALALAALLAGLLSAKHEAKNGLLTGLRATLPCIAAVLLAALFTVRFHPDLRLALSAIIFLLCGVIGGVFGVNLGYRSAPQKRRRKK